MQDKSGELRALSEQALRTNQGDAFVTALQAEINFVRYTTNNIFTIQHMFELWMENFRDNIFHHIHDQVRLEAIPYDGRPVVCVGAGPSLTDKNLALLKGRDDIYVICVNKIAERLLKYRTPDLVLTIHGTNEVLPHFQGPRVTKALKEGMNIALSTVTEPTVTDQITKHAPPEHIYWFNMSVPEEYMANVDAMMKLMSYQLPTFDTGGNVGLCTVILARETIGAKVVGIWGMETSYSLDEAKKKGIIKACEIQYWPDQDQLLAVPPPFHDYAVSMGAFLGNTRDKCEYFNLTPVGIPFVNGPQWGLPYMTPEAFLKKYKGETLILSERSY